MNKTLINPNNTALMVIDIQNDYCSNNGVLALERGYDPSPVKAIVEPLMSFVKSAKSAGLPVIYTKMDENHNDMPKNAQIHFDSDKYGIDICTPGTKGYEYYKVKPDDDDYEIKKNSYDAFINPELNRLLQKLNIENIIFTGAYTSACVDSTLRTAYTFGYNCIVAEDLVAMLKEREYMHKATIDNWRLLFAHVVNSDEIVQAWNN